ncbi:hypothetical protein G9A89_002860 [Geosiphon pyriformis]|nr:hypothetical protein G9A89_002860 [Geosiphon pyriformis]
MTTSKTFLTLLFLFILTLLSSKSVDAKLPGKWPAPILPPPTKKIWNKLVKKRTLPKISLVQSVGVCTPGVETCNWSCDGCTRPDDIVECPDQGDWGLSYDDGPSPYTDKLIDALDAAGVKATFFLVGFRVVEYPEIVKKAVDSGHEIAIHTWSHTALTTQSTEQIIAEIKWTEKAIEAATGGLIPTLVRPPYGDYDDRVRGIIEQLGYKTAIWDRDSRDWVSVSDPNFEIQWVTDNFTLWSTQKTELDYGHISLEHDLYEHTAELAPDAMNILKDAGWKLKTIAECTSVNPYKNNTNSGSASLGSGNLSKSSTNYSTPGNTNKTIESKNKNEGKRSGTEITSTKNNSTVSTQGSNQTSNASRSIKLILKESQTKILLMILSLTIGFGLI